MPLDDDLAHWVFAVAGRKECAESVPPLGVQRLRWACFNLGSYSVTDERICPVKFEPDRVCPRADRFAGCGRRHANLWFTAVVVEQLRQVLLVPAVGRMGRKGSISGILPVERVTDTRR
jgi:hypothetical protein